MPTVPPPSPTAPEAVCPTCGAPGNGHKRTELDILTATYLCPVGHLWMTHWTEAV